MFRQIAAAFVALLMLAHVPAVALTLHACQMRGSVAVTLPGTPDPVCCNASEPDETPALAQLSATDCCTESTVAFQGNEHITVAAPQPTVPSAMLLVAVLPVWVVAPALVGSPSVTVTAAAAPPPGGRAVLLAHRTLRL